MNIFLPSYDECREICDATDNFLFYEMKYVIEGYNVSIFDYKLAGPDVFRKPVPNKDYTALELRGLTFVWNTDGTLYKRYLLLNKFFNINQCESTQYHLIKNYELDTVYHKEDGSLATYVRLPNGNIVAKSKASFISEQAEGSQKMLDNNKVLYDFVSECLDNDIIPIFEYVSPYNRVVIKYDKEEVILLRLRDNKTGLYLSLNEVPQSINKAIQYDFTLDDVISLSKTLEDSEGFVLQFKNGLISKQKTQWYYDRHGLYTEKLYRENDLIKLILDEEIDDILAVLNDPLKNKEVDIVTAKLNKYILTWVTNVNKLLEDYHGDMKAYTAIHLKSPGFHFSTEVIYGIDIIETIKKYILKETLRLEKARTFLNNITIN